MNNEILARAKTVRLLILDSDGVLTDGRVWVGPEGQEWLAFDRRDGEGIRRVRGAGIEVAFVSREHSEAMHKRAAKLVVVLFPDACEKAAAVRYIVREFNAGHLRPSMGEPFLPNPQVGLVEVAYMGDDEPDVEAMALVGLAIAPADAHPAARQAAHWITRAKGGRGAVREVCDLLCSARNSV